MKKINKKIISSILLLALSAPILAQQAGDGHSPQPRDPELTRLYGLRSAEMNAGEACYDRGEYALAAERFKAEIKIEDQIERKFSAFVSAGHSLLARTLVKLNRKEEALTEYRRSVSFERGDFWQYGAGTRMYIEYADLLCDMGKEEDAKAIYYVALRKVDWSAEPFPLLIVFDYDPGMEVWNYTKETFKAATCMVHIATCESSNVKLIASLKQLAPSWSAPRVYESYGDGKRGLPSLTEAYSKATTPEQRGWIQEFIDLNKATVDDYAAARDAIVKQHSQIGQERRAASAVLRQAKLDLATKFRHLARDASEVRLKQ